MQSTKVLSVLMCVMGVFFADATAATINFPGGRIAYSADGNQHDHDDIGATAASIAMVSSAGLGNKLVHYDFSNHLGDNNKEMDNNNIESALGGAKRFGLDTSKFFNDQTQLKEAIDNFKKEGNKSSEDDPLWYICAGPMEVAWRCVNAVDPEKRKHIHVISHHGWNDRHADTPEMTHRWEDIGKLGATMHKIQNQNNSNGDNDFSSPLSEWQWLKNSDNENWKWLYSRNQFKNKFDISDSGMMYWLITGGPNGGNQKGGSNELKNLLSNPVKVPESRTEKESAQKEPAKLIYTGRLAVSHDGNIHDEDDWGALAFVWGIVASFGMQEKLVHVDHSDHLVDNTARGEKQMILSAEGWKYFPGFDSSIVFNAWRDLEGAIANFKKQAEAGSETNILSYMCAGPMEVPWQCINAVTPSKRKFIRVISHSGWNNKHTWKNPDGKTSHTWNDMISSFQSDGVKFVKISGQNKLLGPDDNDWSFLNNMPNDTCIPASAWKWMLSREQKHSDVSDCGMTWFCLTGDEMGTGAKFEARFKNPIDPKTDVAVAAEPAPARPTTSKMVFSDPKIRKPDGDGSVDVGGDLRQWHKVSLTLNGPYAHELDTQPNPFTDYCMTVTFKHESGEPVYKVPGYFAADGKAGESGADCGTSWRAHLSPDKTGKWSYSVQFAKGSQVAIGDEGQALKPYDGQTGSFVVRKSNKKGRDFRAQGRLQYVGKHHLQFAQSGKYFLKAGPDSPETFLAYEDFDGTYTVKNKLKTWEPHLQDAKKGDPTWRDGKGKAILGALNYLSDQGANAFSFLTYNAGGDGDNIWPFVERDAKFHYDCSKLDQWQIVFDHAQKMGLYLHFKMQEQENDDNHKGNKGQASLVPASLDDGDLGPERKLYCRELIARFGYELALNWNLGEENTQSTKQQEAMAAYIDKIDVFNHNIVVHSFPPWQDRVYYPLLGDKNSFTGASLQNHWNHTHERTLQWIAESAAAGKPWIVANDEQGPAGQGAPPDPGYQGFDAEKLGYDLHDVRKQTLWGNIMAGGAGVEYYFGYKLPQNDLLCEDYRSRDQSWDFCNIALTFFDQQKIPFQDMVNRNALIGNADNGKDKYCLAKDGEIYLVYLGYVPTTEIDLSETSGNFKVQWFNPRSGGKLESGSVKRVKGGSKVALGDAPSDPDEDWLVILRK